VNSPRRGRRFRVAWPLQYRRVGSVAWLPARTVNVSNSGVLFRAVLLPDPAERVELRLVIRPPSSLSVTVLEVIGRVVRYEPTATGTAAVEFQSEIAWSPAPLPRPVRWCRGRDLGTLEPFRPLFTPLTPVPPRRVNTRAEGRVRGPWRRTILQDRSRTDGQSDRDVPQRPLL